MRKMFSSILDIMGSLPYLEDGKTCVEATGGGRDAFEAAGGGWEVHDDDMEAAGGGMDDSAAEASGLEDEAEVCHRCVRPQASAR